MIMLIVKNYLVKHNHSVIFILNNATSRDDYVEITHCNETV